VTRRSPALSMHARATADSSRSSCISSRTRLRACLDLSRAMTLVIGMVGRQFLQVLLNTVPALVPNNLALVHEQRKVEVVSFDRVLDSCLLPCIGKVRGRYSATFNIEGEQHRIVLVNGIEQLRIFIPNITEGADPRASRSQREERAFLAVPGIPTDPEVLPIEREPPVPP
jgi:hypothetical protein